ncbi:hypothetical protein FA13DRAFT_1859977 [Coprinellus micaceus]|uniref:Uncharacterized protein n=1 Tax=Coprinellus micaceus TaxID=71717 RepID=A0A4Y7SAE9_COPMI|nr:hypothetical protein FA13DRAFT_1859977 [Coprinellus micaceus]
MEKPVIKQGAKLNWNTFRCLDSIPSHCNRAGFSSCAIPLLETISQTPSWKTLLSSGLCGVSRAVGIFHSGDGNLKLKDYTSAQSRATLRSFLTSRRENLGKPQQIYSSQSQYYPNFLGAFWTEDLAIATQTVAPMLLCVMLSGPETKSLSIHQIVNDFVVPAKISRLSVTKKMLKKSVSTIQGPFFEQVGTSTGSEGHIPDGLQSESNKGASALGCLLRMGW